MKSAREVLGGAAACAIVAALWLPLWSRARQPEPRGTCPSNLKRIAAAFLHYAHDHNQRLPLIADGQPGDRVRGVANPYGGFGAGVRFSMAQSTLQPYVRSSAVWACPDDASGRASGNSYAANGCAFAAAAQSGRKAGKSLAYIKGTGDFEHLPRWMLLGEEARDGEEASTSTDDGYFSLPAGNAFSARHGGGSNVAFLDGHARWMRVDEARSRGVAVGGARAVGERGACP